MKRIAYRAGAFLCGAVGGAMAVQTVPSVVNAYRDGRPGWLVYYLAANAFFFIAIPIIGSAVLWMRATTK